MHERHSAVAFKEHPSPAVHQIGENELINGLNALRVSARKQDIYSF